MGFDKDICELEKADHKLMHLLRLKDLEQVYRKLGDESTRFYISFLDDNPRPDAAVIQALNEGASRIILSEVFVTISNHTREGEELVEALNVPEYGVDVFYTGPLWDSDTLQHMFVDRANLVVGNTPKDQGRGTPCRTWTARRMGSRVANGDPARARVPSSNFGSVRTKRLQPKKSSCRMDGVQGAKASLCN